MNTMRAHTAKPGYSGKHTQEQKGSVLVEFALILPVFLMLLFGVVSFSLALYNKTVLTMATREGARAGAIYTPDQTDTDIMNSASASALEVFEGNLISFGTDMMPTVTPSIAGDVLTVSANITYTGLFVFWNAPDFLISAQTSMRIE